MGRRVRRLGLLLAVMVLCGAAYLAGIWTGARASVTCTTTSPGHIVCGTGELPPATPVPTPSIEQSPSA